VFDPYGYWLKWSGQFGTLWDSFWDSCIISGYVIRDIDNVYRVFVGISPPLYSPPPLVGSLLGCGVGCC